jgi:hypothetical protein
VFVLLLLFLLLPMASASAADNTVAGHPTAALARAAFFDAARDGDLDMIQSLVKAGAPINSRDDKDYTALILAAYHGHLDIVDWLIEPLRGRLRRRSAGQYSVDGGRIPGLR